MPGPRTERTMNRRELLWALVAILLIGAGIYAWKEYDRGIAATGTRPVMETVTAAQLLADFQADEAAATSRYVGATEQVVQVRGTIRSIAPMGGGITNVVLETGDALAGVLCEFPESDLPPDWREGDQVSVRGVCTGFLLDVVLIRCIAA